MVVNKEGAHNVVDDYSRYIVSIDFLFLMQPWHLICRILFPNVIYIYIFYFTLVHSLYILMVIIIVYFICTSNQSGKFQVKDMNVYIKPLIYELLKLWNGITMYDVYRPMRQKKFQFHAILAWKIHDAPRLTHFCGLYF